MRRYLVAPANILIRLSICIPKELHQQNDYLLSLVVLQ